MTKLDHSPNMSSQANSIYHGIELNIRATNTLRTSGHQQRDRQTDRQTDKCKEDFMMTENCLKVETFQAMWTLMFAWHEATLL